MPTSVSPPDEEPAAEDSPPQPARQARAARPRVAPSAVVRMVWELLTWSCRGAAGLRGGGEGGSAEPVGAERLVTAQRDAVHDPAEVAVVTVGVVKRGAVVP